MKEGALAYTIGLIDLIGQGTLMAARNYGSWALEIYISLGLIYWALTLCIEKGIGLLEAHLGKGRRGIV
jgi:L-cystine transport system permease protein